MIRDSSFGSDEIGLTFYIKGLLLVGSSAPRVFDDAWFLPVLRSRVLEVVMLWLLMLVCGMIYDDESPGMFGTSIGILNDGYDGYCDPSNPIVRLELLF